MQRPRLKPGEDDLEEMARQFEAEKSRAGSAGSIHPSNVVNMRQNSDKRQVEEGAKPKSSLFAQSGRKKLKRGQPFGSSCQISLREKAIVMRKTETCSFSMTSLRGDALAV